MAPHLVKDLLSRKEALVVCDRLTRIKQRYKRFSEDGKVTGWVFPEAQTHSGGVGDYKNALMIQR